MPRRPQPTPPPEGAKAVARDLVRLVRAVEEGAGLDALTGMQRAQIDAVRRALVKVVHDRPPRETSGDELKRLRSHLGAMRDGILAQLSRKQRLAVLEALLAVEVAEPEMEMLMAAPPPDEPADAPPVGEPSRRAAARARGEIRRRHEEARTVDVNAGVAQQLARLPRPWRVGIWRNMGLAGPPRPEILARYLLTHETLRALVDRLLPAERAALDILLRGGGLVLARVIEQRFGPSTDDGWDWDRERPTSVLGRLRLHGLVTVGRLPLPGNARSRPRVVLVPRDLQEPLARALAEQDPLPMGPVTVAPDIIDETMAERQTRGEPSFAHAQPELYRFARSLAGRLAPKGKLQKPRVLLGLAAGIWRSFARAHRQRLPRARNGHIEAARRSALDDLAAVEVTHERLLERRVSRMLESQPHLYGYVAAYLEGLRWPEEEKLVVFHACDVAIRALHGTLDTH